MLFTVVLFAVNVRFQTQTAVSDRALQSNVLLFVYDKFPVGRKRRVIVFDTRVRKNAAMFFPPLVIGGSAYPISPAYF